MKKIILVITLFFCYKGIGQQVIYLQESSGRIFTIDLNNCSQNTICNTVVFPDFAVTPNGNMWGINSPIHPILSSINITNGAVTYIGNPASDDVVNSLVALNDSTLLFEKNLNLYGINVNDASTFLIGYIGYHSAGDLAWYDNDLYMVTDMGLLIKIVLNNTNTSIISSNPVNDLLHKIPECLGLVNASFGNTNTLVGFKTRNDYTTTDAFKICPINGSYQAICSFPSGDVRGADSVRLPSQVITPTCTQVLATEKVNHSLFEIYPNPVLQNEILHIGLHSQTNNLTTTKIINYQGQILYSKKELIKTGEIMISLNGCEISKGVYLIEITTDGETSTSKLIVK